MMEVHLLEEIEADLLVNILQEEEALVVQIHLEENQ
jgi:hypothetical protein